MIVYATCHPKRRTVSDGRCRECVGLAATPEDLLPAVVVCSEQRAGPEVPPACRRCGGPWVAHAGYVMCFTCGSTWHLTSRRVLRPPRTINEHARAAQALSRKKEWT